LQPRRDTNEMLVQIKTKCFILLQKNRNWQTVKECIVHRPQPPNTHLVVVCSYKLAQVIVAHTCDVDRLRRSVAQVIWAQLGYLHIVSEEVHIVSEEVLHR